MAQPNKSEGMPFILPATSSGQSPTTMFGELDQIDGLAISPESTGVTMQVDGMINHRVATRSDLKAVLSATALVEGELERTIGNPDYLPVWFLQAGTNRARAVCKIETSGVDYAGNDGVWQGTGFLISNNILITNHHVLNTTAVCANALCIFNYQADESGKLQTTQTYRLNPDRLFLTSPVNSLDFTLCWVDSEPGKEMGYVPIYRHAFTIKSDDCANIIQHPEGQLKSVVVQKNEVRNQNELVVHYASDTLPGSSGAGVFNNAWRLVALHHASRKVKDATLNPFKPAEYVNEGIKFSAIAAYLESITSPERSAADEVLALVQGTDSLMGYFGGLGRQTPALESGSILERVKDIYRGEARDIDVGFWNIEWFNKHYQEKMEAVASIIVKMNLDVWAFEETSPQATQALVTYLKEKYQLDYGQAASEPNAASGKQTTTLIWNTQTITCERQDWSPKVQRWLALTSGDYADATQLNLESDSNELLLEKIDGKIFDRYPGLFKVTTTQRKAGDQFDFYVVPLHLKAMAEGSKRRAMASRILAVAVDTMIREEGADADWILGGDLNATLASGDLDYLSNGNLTAVSAEDEQGKAFSYVKQPYRSLIDHVFLSPNLTKVADPDFFIIAQDRVLPDYLSISDHRPVLVRLSLTDKVAAVEPEKPVIADDRQELITRLNQLRDRPMPTTSLPVRAGDESALADALDALRANQNRPYYDETADTQARLTYYGSLPTGAGPDQLYRHMSDLITRTHTKQLGYSPSVHLYPWADLQPDGRSLHSIYSGEQADPEAFIRADAEAVANRQQALETWRTTASRRFESTSALEAERVVADLEAEFPFNCEHVVPQSWFSKKNPMRGDLHHLFACNPRCNSFRSNTPFFEFADWEERTMQDCGRSESNAFEPRSGKGAVARATLYFILRYPGIIRQTTNQYPANRLPILLEWHLTEPPDVYEKHRNAAIQELQGNRNPLIDFPQLATRIDFLVGLKP